MGSVLDALFPRTRQRVLSLLFGQPDRSFATMELIGLARAGSGAVQRELDRLVGCALVTVTRVGNQKRFQANRVSPFFAALHDIIDKTAGIADAVAMALGPLASSIRFATLYGSVAKGTASGISDIDVLIVTDDLTLERVFAAFEPVEKRFGIPVSPTLYTADEFLRRRAARHPFLTKVLAGKHVVLIGSEDAIRPR